MADPSRSRVSDVLPAAARTLHVLTLTPFFPHQADDARGCFVAEPLRLMPQFGVRSTVMAVQPVHRSYRRQHSSLGRAHSVRYLAFPGNPGLPSSGAFLYAQLRSRVRRLHQELPIDLIHAHVALPCGQAAAMLSRDLQVPFVVSVHGLDAFATNQVRGWLGRWCERASRRVYESASCVLCVSEKVRQEVCRGCALQPVNCQVVYNGADPQLFSPAIDHPGEPEFILSVGNLDPIKGHQLVVRAFAQLAWSHPRLRYEIIGTGPELPRLAALARDLAVADRIKFLGRQSRQQVARKMRQCSVFVLPSSYEALGCVYLEAMACAIPTVACKEQGIAELIRHADNGWLISPGSLSELTQGLAELLGDAQLRKRVGEAGRRTFTEHFSIAHQAAAWAQIYREHCA